MIAPIVTGHDHCKHFLVTHGVIQLCWKHVLKVKGNRKPVTLTNWYCGRISFCPICAVINYVCLLQDKSSFGKSWCVNLHENWISEVIVSKNLCLCEGIAKFCEILLYCWSEYNGPQKTAIHLFFKLVCYWFSNVWEAAKESAIYICKTKKDLYIEVACLF
jgi:hypothetical protein